MKAFVATTTTLFTLICTCPVMAAETDVQPSAAQAKETWQAMTPEQQAAAKGQAKEMGQQKAQAWQQMSQDQRQQKMQGMREQMRAHRAGR